MEKETQKARGLCQVLILLIALMGVVGATDLSKMQSIIRYDGKIIQGKDLNINNGNWSYLLIEKENYYNISRKNHSIKLPKRDWINYNFGLDKISWTITVNNLQKLIDISKLHNSTTRYVGLPTGKFKKLGFTWANKDFIFDKELGIFDSNQDSIAYDVNNNAEFKLVNNEIRLYVNDLSWFINAEYPITFSFSSIVVNSTFEAGTEGFVYLDCLWNLTACDGDYTSGTRINESKCLGTWCLLTDQGYGSGGTFTGGWNRTIQLNDTGTYNISWFYHIESFGGTESTDYLKLSTKNISGGNIFTIHQANGDAVPVNNTFSYTANVSSGTHNIGWTSETKVSSGVEQFKAWVDNVVIEFVGGASNSAPDTPSLSTTPATVYTNTTLVNCSTTITDPDGDNMNATFSWYNGTNLLKTCTFNNQASGTLLTCNTTNNTLWVHFDELNCTLLLEDNNSNDAQNSSLINVSNLAPLVTLNYPADNATNMSLNITLNATVWDTDLDLMNVSFYNGSNNYLFCLNTSITNGTDVLCNIYNLTCNWTFTWYVNVTDFYTTTMSTVQNFTTENCSTTSTTTTTTTSTTTTTAPTTTTTAPGATTTTAPTTPTNRQMIYPVYYTLIAVASCFSLLALAFGNPRTLILYPIAGLAWLVVAGSSGEVNEVIVYTATNYLQGTQYPMNVILFSMLSLGFFTKFIMQFFDWYSQRAEEVIQWK